MRGLAWCLVAGGVLVGCDAATAPEPFAADAAFNTAISEKATGSGHFDVGGELRTFSFNAIQRSDGKITGQWQVKNRLLEVIVHGNVTCITVIGNSAWIGGSITSSSDPTFVGNDARWRVIDNGEGASAPPDQISQIPAGLPPGAAQAFCDAAPLVGVNDIVQGNIQIR